MKQIEAEEESNSRPDARTSKVIEDLENIANSIEKLLPKFVKQNRLGLTLPSSYAAELKRHVLEAKAILEEELGSSNDYSDQLIQANLGLAGGWISFASVEEAPQIIKAGIRKILRREQRPTSPSLVERPFVDPSRIAALQALSNARWDCTRLVELCREINVASANRCHMSTAMILRAILDHVPPIFGVTNFAEVASNYGGPKGLRSFKANMQRMQGSLRSIADAHLHLPIREREVVPTAVQVDFRADLDVLLGEIIRVSDGSPRES